MIWLNVLQMIFSAKQKWEFMNYAYWGIGTNIAMISNRNSSTLSIRREKSAKNIPLLSKIVLKWIFWTGQVIDNKEAAISFWDEVSIDKYCPKWHATGCPTIETDEILV
jgi:hypothetical protein